MGSKDQDVPYTPLMDYAKRALDEAGGKINQRALKSLFRQVKDDPETKELFMKQAHHYYGLQLLDEIRPFALSLAGADVREPQPPKPGEDSTDGLKAMAARTRLSRLRGLALKTGWCPKVTL